MANVLKVHKMQIDLDSVSEMSDEDYNTTYNYVRQWDNQGWTNALHEARTGEAPSAEPEAEEEPDDEESDDPIDNMTVEELKAELTLHDLPHSGNKAELQQRLRDAGGLK